MMRVNPLRFLSGWLITSLEEKVKSWIQTKHWSRTRHTIVWSLLVLSEGCTELPGYLTPSWKHENWGISCWFPEGYLTHASRGLDALIKVIAVTHIQLCTFAWEIVPSRLTKNCISMIEWWRASRGRKLKYKCGKPCIMPHTSALPSSCYTDQSFWLFWVKTSCEGQIAYLSHVFQCAHWTRLYTCWQTYCMVHYFRPLGVFEQHSLTALSLIISYLLPENSLWLFNNKSAS